MSGVSGLGSSTTSGTLGDAPPVSFPGVSSGIDYNSIIKKYTQQTLLQEQPLKAQVNNINSANTAVLKIKNLLATVQDSITALSDPAVFGAYKATAGNNASGSTSATLTQVSGQSPVAGTYTINAQTAATATTIVNNAAANAALNTGVALSASGASITASNGSGANGKITINGVQVNYDVGVDSLTTILTRINANVAGVNATYNAVTGAVTITGVTSLGSGADSGNLAQVLKLDTAQIVAGTVTSSSAISGINQTSTLNTNNNAGFATLVTSGTFTINGVQFTVNQTTDAVSDIISRINASSAGVTAAYNSATSQITLTSNSAGPQSILVGATGDTSNFLTAAGIKTGTTTVGTQASLTYTVNSATKTIYSSSNTFSNVVPGFNLTVTDSSPATLPVGSTYYTVAVTSDPSQAEKAINTFVKAYNAAIQEINKDIKAPTVTTGKTSTGTAASASSGGGVLYGNYEVSSVRDQLVGLVSGFLPSGSSAYNSLQSVGLKLNTSSQSVGTQDANDSTDTSDSSSSGTVITGGTDGTLAALDTTAFEAAYSANNAAVQSLFTLTPPTISATASYGSYQQQGGLAYSVGSLIANSIGISTFLKSSVITPQNLSAATLSQVLDSNYQQIDSIDKQITVITREANQQADSLRAQFSSSEAQIAQLQALQQQISAIGH